MKIMGKVSLSFFVRVITDIMITVNLATLILLPWALRFLLSALKDEYMVIEDFTFLLYFLYVCGALTGVLLVLGHCIMRTLEKGLPFDPKNARYFLRIGIVFMLLSAAFWVKIFIYNTFLTLFCAGIFAIFALLAVILSEIFRQASLIWEEHQLTI